MNYVLFFIRDLGVIMNRFGSKFGKNL